MKYSFPSRSSADLSDCAAKISRESDIFGICLPPRSAAPYANSTCTFEDCELGDLSSKFGLFQTASVSEDYEDPTLTMFGELRRSEEHTSELQSLMRIPYAVFCLQKTINQPI